jgi:hypothetical protein
MLKLIITGLLIYFLYRSFFKKTGIGTSQREDRHIDTNKEEDEGEFIDYEEVD